METRSPSYGTPKRDAERGVYVKVIGEGSPLRVASNPGFQVTWSPDGRSIAFARAGDDGGIFTVPATGGTERRLTERTRAVCVVTRSKDIGYCEPQFSAKSFQASSYLRLEQGRVHQLTSPPPGAVGDTSPSFSPDGQTAGVYSTPRHTGKRRLCNPNSRRGT